MPIAEIIGPVEDASEEVKVVTIEVDGTKFDNVDRDWSFKNFSNMPVPDLPDNIVVYSTLFYHETDAEPFRRDLSGVTFVKCNLDNLVIPEGNTVIQCSQNRFKVQNDRNDWLLDERGDVAIPMNYRTFEKLDLPMPKPEDIPLEMAEEAIDLIAVAREKPISDPAEIFNVTRE